MVRIKRGSYAAVLLESFRLSRCVVCRRILRIACCAVSHQPRTSSSTSPTSAMASANTLRAATSATPLTHPPARSPILTDPSITASWPTRLKPAARSRSCCPPAPSPQRKSWPRADAFQKKQQEILQQNTLKANPQMAQQAARPAAQNQAAAGYAMPAPPKNAEEREMRRCVSSGRLASSCTGNQLLGAFTGMISSVLGSGDNQKKAPPSGPNMAGVFQGAGGWRLDFIDGGVLVNCAGLSPNQEPYSVSFKTGHAVLTIATTPRPLVLNIHGDSITGPPGAVTIDGVIAAGYVGGAQRHRREPTRTRPATSTMPTRIKSPEMPTPATPDSRPNASPARPSISRQKAQASASRPCRPIC